MFVACIIFPLGTVHVPLVTLRNTPGTMLVLVLFTSAFWVRNLPEKRKMDILGTNMYCTAFEAKAFPHSVRFVWTDSETMKEEYRMITNWGKKEQKEITPFIRPTKTITQPRRTLY